MTKVGIDIGGTFTDLILIDEKRTATYKLPSTPDNPGRAALEGLAVLLAREGIAPSAVAMLAHGTTVATNTVIQRKGAKTALITTRGFRDVLEIARLGRPPEAIYDIQYETAPPLVPRHLRFEVSERVNYRGEVVSPLNEAEVVQIAERLKAARVEAVAVCLLFSFLYPEHEQMVRRLLQRELPHSEIFLSSDILPERREYERTSTTVIAAYLAPAVTHYIRHMQKELAHLALQDKFYIMQSNGGLNTPETAILNPATMVLSGPAGGAIAAWYLGELAGFRDLLSVDMGGTSFDVCLIRHGEQLLTAETKVLEHPLNVPMLDIHTIGAGGGSIAWLDAGGGLRVGPHSAGARPGPACYGQGGTEPTVTDANVVLGFLNPTHLLDGSVPIDRGLAAAAILRMIGAPLGLSLPEAAEGIYRIINATMAGATRVMSVEKGYDPREFALIAFGGAGPVHAAELAEEMAIPWILVPRYPGITSAAGLVFADILHDYVQTLVVELSGLDLTRWNEAYLALESRGHADLERDRVPASDRLFLRLADLKYVGQGYHLTVPVPGDPLAEPSQHMVLERFHARHEQLYGFCTPEEPVELVNARVRAIGKLVCLPPPETRAGPPDPRAALIGERPAFFRRAGGMVKASVYDRARLRPGHVIEGPAIVEQPDSTTVIPPGMHATVDGYENLIVGHDVWRKHGSRGSDHL